MVGKTTTPEFAYSSFTESPLWGITRNPWNTERTPGGSSGGSGAAVASGCVPLAGGLRHGRLGAHPGSWWGMVGLKPSFGRIPLDFLPTQFDTIHHFGPLARTVDDARLFLQVAQGPDERDIMSAAAARPRRHAPGHVEGLRLALDVDLGHYAIDPEVEARGARRRRRACRAGAVVEEVELGWTREMHRRLGRALGRLPGRDLRARSSTSIATGWIPAWWRCMDAGLAMSAVDFKRIEFVRTEAWKRARADPGALRRAAVPDDGQAARPVDEDDARGTATYADGRYHGLDMTAVSTS